MATSGINKNKAGEWHVDKFVRKIRLRATFRTFAEANEWVTKRSYDIDRQMLFGERPSMTFSEAVARYLEEKFAMNLPSVVTDAYMLKALLPYIGHMQISLICDASFESFRKDRFAQGRSPKTVRASLSAAGTVLRLAEKMWRSVPMNLAYLDRAPMINLPKLAGNQRLGRPIMWYDQDRLIDELPPHLRAMTLFAINTGARDNVIVNLRWSWLCEVSRLNTYYFKVPKEFVKGRVFDRPLILNSVAKNIVSKQTGLHADYVFVYRREPTKNFLVTKYAGVTTMNNTAWQKARTRAGLGDLHVHDLRTTFATRLRAAGVPQPQIAELLWHGKSSVTELYISEHIRALERLVELIVARDDVEDVPLRVLMATPDGQT